MDRLKYLLDTNIVLETLLNQARAGEVDTFLKGADRGSLAISEFSVYSIGVILSRHGQLAGFVRVVDDLVVNGGVSVARLSPSDYPDLVAAASRWKLDFDDAYQYTLAKKLGLALVSFDSDFDRSDRGRKEPKDLASGSSP